MHPRVPLQIVLAMAVIAVTTASADPRGARTAVDLAIQPRAAAAQVLTPTPAPGEPTIVFSDDFEDGHLMRWTTIVDLLVQNEEVASGNVAARAVGTDGSPSFARTQLPAGRREVSVRVSFKLLDQGDN